MFYLLCLFLFKSGFLKFLQTNHSSLFPPFLPFPPTPSPCPTSHSFLRKGKGRPPMGSLQKSDISNWDRTKSHPLYHSLARYPSTENGPPKVSSWTSDNQTDDHPKCHHKPSSSNWWKQMQRSTAKREPSSGRSKRSKRDYTSKWVKIMMGKCSETAYPS